MLLLTPIISVDGGHRHRPLQHHGYCVPLLRRQVFVFHAIFWWFLRLQRYTLPAKSLSLDRLFFFLGGYLPPGLREDPGNVSPRHTEDNLLTHLCNHTSKVVLSISFRDSYAFHIEQLQVHK